MLLGLAQAQEEQQGQWQHTSSAKEAVEDCRGCCSGGLQQQQQGQRGLLLRVVTHPTRDLKLGTCHLALLQLHAMQL
jgi:hypothetical protein